jgi:hypothetical protein
LRFANIPFPDLIKLHCICETEVYILINIFFLAPQCENGPQSTLHTTTQPKASTKPSLP